VLAGFDVAAGHAPSEGGVIEQEDPAVVEYPRRHAQMSARGRRETLPHTLGVGAGGGDGVEDRTVVDRERDERVARPAHV
jgi:hypothetical protein